MKHSKKILTVIVIAIIIAVPAYLYNKFQGGTYYYTQITKEPTKVEDSLDDRGIKQGSVYTYNLASYDNKGTEKDIQFDAYKDKPLKQNAYLKIKVNDIKGVLTWSEVQKNDIPTDALSKLNKKTFSLKKLNVFLLRLFSLFSIINCSTDNWKQR